MPRREITIYSSEDGSTHKRDAVSCLLPNYRQGWESQRIFDLSDPDKTIYPSEFFRPVDYEYCCIAIHNCDNSRSA